MRRLSRWLLSRPLAPVRTRTARRTPPALSKPQLLQLEDRLVPTGRPLPMPVVFAAGGAGSEGVVSAYNADTGAVNFAVHPYEAGFTGGVHVAAADLNGDGVPDLVTGSGPGGGPRVRAFDGKTGAPLAGPLGNFWAFEESFTGGVTVAVGDVTGDGVPDIVAGAGAGGGPRVKVFDGATGAVVADFWAFEPSFTGGVTVAAADLTLDGRAEVLVGAGVGGGPRVTAFDLASGQPVVAKGFYTNFLAGDAAARDGAVVAVGDVNGDTIPDVIVGPAGGSGAPHVTVFNGFDGSKMADFQPFAAGVTGGASVSSFYLTADADADVVVASAAGGVRTFQAGTGQLVSGPAADFAPFGGGAGVAVAAANDPGTNATAIGLTVGTTSAGAGQVIAMTASVVQSYGGGGGGDDVSPPIPYPPPPAVTPTGTVNVYVQETAPATGNVIPLGTYPVAGAGGSAAATVTTAGLALAAGTYNAWLTYAGDAYYAANAKSVPVSITVSPPAGPTPTPDCGCGGTPDAGTAAPEGAGLNAPAATTAGGVRPADGSVKLTDTAFTGAAVGDSDFAQAVGWTNAPGYADGDGGAGTDVLTAPALTQVNGDDAIAVSTGTAAAVFFDSYAGAYHARYNAQATLAHAGGQFTVTDGRGGTQVFYDFSSGTPTGRAGRMVSSTTADGTTISVTSWDGSGRPTEMQRVVGSGSTAVTESLLTTYVATGDNAGLVATATLRRKVGSGSWATVREADYAYYANTDANGRATQLKTAAVKDGSGTVLDATYYRYYVPTSGLGLLKYQFGTTAYGELTGALGTGVDALTDAQVSGYADHALAYDSSGRVTTHTAAGAGCSICSGGQGTYTYSYSSNVASGVAVQGGTNVWATKTVETLPDGNTNTYYTNSSGQVMLKVYADAATSAKWGWYTRYDADGRAVFTADPSAVTGYDDSYSDLLDNTGGNYYYLADSTGLVSTNAYATATTATSSAAGDVAGYLSGTAIQQGELGTAVPQSAMSYVTRTAGGQDNYFPASTTQYRNADGTGGQTTTLAYTWQGSTATPASVTTTLPTVTTAENGPNSATATVTVNDSFGRPIWQKDAAGFLTYTAYDAQTGAVVKTIADVNTANTGDFANLPSGWTTPAGGGAHLITTYEVDGLGRTTKSVSPGGRVDYTVYDDADHEVRSYPAWNSSTNLPTGPTTVTRDDRANGYTETLTMSATPAVSGGRPTGAESISSLESLSRSYRNDAGQVTHTDSYFNLTGVTYSTAPNLGTLNTNYYRTTTDYGKEDGQANRQVSAAGTITRTEYDGLGRATSVWVGTDDTPTTGYWSTSNLAGTDMVETTAYEYDGGGVGDGTVTKVTQYPGGGAAARVTQTFYDWRDRAVAVKSGVETTESTSVNRPITYDDYDNLGEVTKTRMYDGDAVTITYTSGVPNAPSSSLLRAQMTTSYDELGRAYRTDTYSVDPSTGSVGAYTLHADTWYDARGNVIKTSAPGGLVQKTSYDGLGRTTVSYTTDGGGDSGYSDAATVTGDTVLTQDETTYDADGNVVLAVHRDRFHDATATGPLGTPSSPSGTAKARVSYAGSYYDLADRPTATVDVGTNGGSAWTLPGSVPARSDSVLVTSQTYDAAGNVYEATDPRGLVTRTLSDALGRTTKTIENYVDGVVSDADDKTTEYAYGPAGMTGLTADLTGGGGQTTAWAYGVTTAGGSAIDSNDVVGATEWPDPTTGAASSGQEDTVTVNALGQPVTTTDRNGTVHALTYDVLGRVVADAVTTLGTGVDGAVRRIETAYDGQGNPYLVTSYGAASGGSVVNQVQRQYNGLGQMTREWQSHAGTVNTSTTPSVQYAYTEMAGGADHSRLTSVTYPSGYVLTYNYSSGLNDGISRLSSLSDSSGTVETYSYLGLGTVVVRGRPQTGVDLTMLGTGPGSGGDQYVGLDSFGRVIDQNWKGSSASTDEFTYTYDRDGNRLTKGNSVNTAFNETYSYDGLNQIASFTRGSHTQAWDYDAVGNMDSVTTDGTAQTRTANAQNEVTGVSGATTPTFDAAGNMTTDETGRQFVYDAWNRMVAVKNSGGTTLKTYAYDGLNHRVAETAGGATTDLYYSADWQVLEEAVSGGTTARYVWSPVYVDAMVLRDRATTTPGTLNERVWVQQDANFNVTAITDGSGAVLERYAYDPFGVRTVLTPSFGSRSASSYDFQHGFQGMAYDSVSGLDVSRMRPGYSPTLGRWVSTDPIRFAAGDNNLYRFVGDSPITNLDPYGLKIYEAADAPASVVFMDEVLAVTFGREKETIDKYPETKKTIDVLLKLKDLANKPTKYVTVKVRYITDPDIGDKKDAPTQFADNIINSKCGADTINLYIGHGLSNAKKNGADTASMDAIRKAFGGFNWNPIDPPLVAFVCCWAGWYNAWVPDAGRIPGAIKEIEKTPTLDKNVPFIASKMFAEVERRIQSAETDQKKLTINLYFGEDAQRNDTNAKKYGSTPQYRFMQWQFPLAPVK